MAKRKKSARSAKARVSRSGFSVQYNSLTFLVFLAFVLLVSLLLVANMLGTY